jgi:hypothetical protein
MYRPFPYTNKEKRKGHEKVQLNCVVHGCKATHQSQQQTYRLTSTYGSTVAIFSCPISIAITVFVVIAI